MLTEADLENQDYIKIIWHSAYAHIEVYDLHSIDYWFLCSHYEPEKMERESVTMLEDIIYDSNMEQCTYEFISKEEFDKLLTEPYPISD